MKIWEAKYAVNTLLLNSQGRMGLYALLNVLQDAAWIHADSLGLGYSFAKIHGIYWALIRQRVQMHKWVGLGERLTIKTWTYPANNNNFHREFLIYDSKGEEIGRSRSVWVTVSALTKKSVSHEQVLGVHDFDWESILHRESLDLDVSKINLPNDFVIMEKFRVRNSDIDINDHVNNTNYARWILDAIPRAWHSQHLLKEYEVNFIAETRLGDSVQIEFCKVDTEQNQNWSYYKGVREGGDGKTVFTARLLTENLEPV